MISSFVFVGYLLNRFVNRRDKSSKKMETNSLQVGLFSVLGGLGLLTGYILISLLDQTGINSLAMFFASLIGYIFELIAIDAFYKYRTEK